MPIHGNGLDLLLILLAAAVLISALFRRINVPPTLAYLCVGLLVHPAPDQLSTIQILAEFGVVFLLFSLGLEFSLPRMLALRHTVFVVGGLQVLICGALIFAAAWLAGATAEQATVIGGALALSSTAVVSKELTTRHELNQAHGQTAIGILLFQDLAAVILLILVPALSDTLHHDALLPVIGITLIKGAILFAVLLSLGKWVLPRLFDEVAKARSEELFVMTVLLTSLLAAALTHTFGLSMALGAFIAGMMLSETHYRHQVEADIRPFRDLLLGLFFVSVGMLIDVRTLATTWHWVLIFSSLLVLGKACAIVLLARWQGLERPAALRAGLYLAQGGEFAFALFALAGQRNLLSPSWQAVLVTTVVISIAMTPVLIGFVTPWLLRRLSDHDTLKAERDTGDLHQASENLRDHVVICGFGRVGQTVARFLRREGIPFLAVDVDPVRVQEASAAGEPVFFGDGTRASILRALGLQRAKLLVISHAETDRAARIITLTREQGLKTPILVRTRDDSELALLQKLGATEVIPETLEASLTLVSHVLMLMGVSAERVFRDISETRRDRYSILHGYYHGLQSRLTDAHGRPLELLHPVRLPTEAWACGKTVADLTLGTPIYAIRREDGSLAPLITEESQLNAGDTVVLQGPHDAVEKAERRLLAG
ncbi:cation:proton antiporter domain-containing protein [Mangrovitalea sediminis]|uniref:cation:proton antiporter domain-containing protein n=1 Tax=Mangrovitalea sediminis TaxID=1982043 RepID=UPI000BE5F500|nr:cation:proton antiporter [Mangrovitalea sediminis]